MIPDLEGALPSLEKTALQDFSGCRRGQQREETAEGDMGGREKKPERVSNCRDSWHVRVCSDV